MAAVPIRLYGDQVLRKECAPVADIDDDVKSLIMNLVDTVVEAEGLGLAAPQIGVAKRVIVVVEPTGDEKRYLGIINPVVVSGLVESGEKVTVEVTGVIARAFCHEIDHLDGVMFVDKIGMVRKGLLRGKLGAIKKQAKELLKSLQ
jgi:peptide deformylase